MSEFLFHGLNVGWQQKQKVNPVLGCLIDIQTFQNIVFYGARICDEATVKKLIRTKKA